MAALIGPWPNAVRAFTDALARELDAWIWAEPLSPTDPRPLHHPCAIAFVELGGRAERALREENRPTP